MDWTLQKWDAADICVWWKRNANRRLKRRGKTIKSFQEQNAMLATKTEKFDAVKAKLKIALQMMIMRKAQKTTFWKG